MYVKFSMCIVIYGWQCIFMKENTVNTVDIQDSLGFLYSLSRKSCISCFLV